MHQQCPACGGQSGEVRLVIGMVMVCTHHCTECKKVWMHAEFKYEVAVSLMEEQVKKLRGYDTASARYALRFLEARIASSSTRTLEQKRLDAWEKKYLKDRIGEDDYDG